jgi:exosortase
MNLASSQALGEEGAAPPGGGGRGPRRWLGIVRSSPVLALAIALWTVPTLVRVAQEYWSREEGVHGPLVLAMVIWLVWRQKDMIAEKAEPGMLWLATLGVGVAGLVYAASRAFDFLASEVAAVLLALLSVGYAFVGHRVLMKLWFPIVYSGFLIPWPGWLLDSVTQPLKIFVSEASTGILKALGYPIIHEGVTIFIAQYQLLVEDACAGLNSIISLLAVGLLYIYLLHNASWRYAVLLAAFVVPVAIAANVVRVIGLVLITYYLGDEAAQGYLHDFAGMVTFTSALLFIFLVDKLLSPLRNWLGGRRAETA